MAGNYPDPPGNRLSYDKDGTIGLTTDFSGGSVLRTFSAAEMLTMTDDSASGPGASGMFNVTLIFPSPRDITHMHSWWGNPNPPTPYMQSSIDTTNGIDGTWLAVTGASYVNSSFSKIQARTPYALTANNTGLKAIRVRDSYGNRSLYGLHLYGRPTEYGDRLVAWHPTLDQPFDDVPADLDWGDRPRDSVATKSFRIKNTSASLTASSIVVGGTPLSAASPTLDSQTQYRVDGGAYDASITIDSIGPGAISPVIDIQQSLLSTAALGLWSHRISAIAGSWS